MKGLKKSKKDKTPKNVELTSIACSEMDTGMEIDEDISLTAFTKRLCTKTGNPPHAHTVKRWLHNFKAIQRLSPIIEIRTDKYGNPTRIMKKEYPDVTYKKEMRTDITNLKNQQDLILEELKKLIRITELNATDIRELKEK